MVAEISFELCEEVQPWGWLPLAVDGGLLTVRHCPVTVKSSEVIYPEEICYCELIFDSLYPPCIACLGMLFPVVQRVAPELPGS